MKVTHNNIKDIPYIKDRADLEKAKEYLDLLLNDLDSINKYLGSKGYPQKKMFIDIETEHTEYSTERTDPCPDFYGMFQLRFERHPNETIGIEMNLDELDTVICALDNYITFEGTL